MIIPALSLWQPWASFMAWGDKVNETRSRAMFGNYRGMVAIHATASIPTAERKLAYDLAYDLIVRREYNGQPVKMNHPEPSPEIIQRLLRSRTPFEDFGRSLPHGAVVCIVNVTDIHRTERIFRSLTYKERLLGNYDAGRFALTTKLIHRLETPSPASGKQGPWNWTVPPELETKLSSVATIAGTLNLNSLLGESSHASGVRSAAGATNVR